MDWPGVLIKTKGYRGRYRYRIDFTRMTQKNMDTGSERAVRIVWVRSEDVEARRTGKISEQFRLGIRPGDWFITHGCVDSYGKRSKNVCKEYDRPPPNGNYVQTFDPNTYIGPVIAVEQRGSFTTITVPGMVQAHGFINVAKHTHRFATLICHEEIKRWKSQGWEQPVWPCPVVE